MPSPTTEALSTVLTDWLSAEIIESDQNRNAVLSDFENRKPDLAKELTDPTNFNGGKALGHHNRLRLWSRQFINYDQQNDDYATARLTFCGLIWLSGNYRESCLLQADDAETYFHLRREQGPLSISIPATVEQELRTESHRSIDLAGLIHRTQAINETNLLTRQRLSPLAAHAPEAIEAFTALQKDWVALSVAQIMTWAAVRDGDLSRVPFFEPKSITDQTELQYPLASI